MKKFIRKGLVLVCIMRAFLLAGCAKEEKSNTDDFSVADNTAEESVFSETESGAVEDTVNTEERNQTPEETENDGITDALEMETFTEETTDVPEETDTEENKDPNALSENWEDGEVLIDGVKYAHPYSISQFEENGFTLDIERIKKEQWYEEMVAPDKRLAYEYVFDNATYDGYVPEEDRGTFDDDSARLGISIKNSTDAEVEFKECSVWILHLMDIYAFDVVDNPIPFELAKGITLGSTIEEITAAYGEPYSINDMGKWTVMRYNAYGVSLQLYVLKEGGLAEFEYNCRQ